MTQPIQRPDSTVDALLPEVTARAARACSRHPVLRAMTVHHWEKPGGLWRARLALEAGLSLGLSARDAVTLAASCELLHNASLVQDDWMDGDAVRRGQHAVWSRFGAAPAVLLGDYWLAAGAAELHRLDVAPEAKLLTVALYLRRSKDAIAGQMEEVLSPAGTFERTRYLHVTAGKTGALLALPVELALAAAGLWRRHGRTARRGLILVGQAYQLIDDIKDGSAVCGLDAGSVVKLCDDASAACDGLPMSLNAVLQHHIGKLRASAQDLSCRLVA